MVFGQFASPAFSSIARKIGSPMSNIRSGSALYVKLRSMPKKYKGLFLQWITEELTQQGKAARFYNELLEKDNPQCFQKVARYYNGNVKFLSYLLTKFKDEMKQEISERIRRGRIRAKDSDPGRDSDSQASAGNGGAGAGDRNPIPGEVPGDA